MQYFSNPPSVKAESLHFVCVKIHSSLVERQNCKNCYCTNTQDSDCVLEMVYTSQALQLTDNLSSLPPHDSWDTLQPPNDPEHTVGFTLSYWTY